MTEVNERLHSCLNLSAVRLATIANDRNDVARVRTAAVAIVVVVAVVVTSRLSMFSI